MWSSQMRSRRPGPRPAARRARSSAPVLAVCLWTAPAFSYEIRGNGIHVSSAADWGLWEYPRQAVVIDSSKGSVRLRSMRTDVDAVRDARRFERPIGEADAYRELLASLTRERRPPPMNVYSRPATIAGAPLTREGPRGSAEPVVWYFLRGGVSAAGTNPEAAARAVDGDASTCWEPLSTVTAQEYANLPREDRGEVYHLVTSADGRTRRVSPPDYQAAPSDRQRLEYHSRSTDTWYLDLDLGRVVAARQVVLRFAPPGQGDPFRRVRLLSSRFSSRHEPFSLLALTTGVNTRRELTFDLDPDGEGYALLHRLRIVVSDSKMERSAVVSASVFESLPLEDQGAVDYYVYDALGGERRTDAESYFRAGASRQGRRRYYRRERPCLSEVEVRTQGDNVALGLEEDGGSAQLSGSFVVDHGFDGLYDTYFKQAAWQPEEQADPELWILRVDLGVAYHLNHLRFVNDGVPQHDLLVVEASGGRREATGELLWRPVLRNEGVALAPPWDRAFETAVTTEHPVRYLRSYVQKYGRGGLGWFTRELQLFAEGHAAEAVLTSPLIELPEAVVVDRVRWQADSPAPAATRVEVRTRFGDLLQDETRYFNKVGYPVSGELHQGMPASFRGPVVTRQVPGAGWSPWSGAYQRSGDRVRAPGPRKFLQLQIRLGTSDPAVTPSIRDIKLSLRPPAARRITAEIWPDHVVPGFPDTFDLYVQPGFVEYRPGGGRSTGFDEIRVDPGSLKDMELVDLRIADLHLKPDPARPGLLSGPAPGDLVRVVEGRLAGGGSMAAEAPRLRLRLARSLGPEPEGRRVYYRRILRAGDEVPADIDGRPLLERTYLRLPETERGRELYLMWTTDAGGAARIDSVDHPTWLGLPAHVRAGARFFRRVDAGEYPFDRAGAPLTREAYMGLPVEERGTVEAEGALLRLRLRGTVVRYGTSLTVEVRRASQDVWQRADPGDATGASPGTSLTIRVPLERRVLRQMRIEPSTLTPNGDGVNDTAQIRFLVAKATIPRPMEVEIFDLTGRRVRHLQDDGAGLAVMRWDGRDEFGRVVAPGLYLCRVRVQVYSDEAGPTSAARAIAVAY